MIKQVESSSNRFLLKLSTLLNFPFFLFAFRDAGAVRVQERLSLSPGLGLID